MQVSLTAKIWWLCFLIGLAIGNLPAQNASLKFDPKWELKVSHSNFDLLHPLVLTSNLLKTSRCTPAAWSYSDLAFFCKIEVKLEKATRFPIKFRLGDVNYVDILEGKRRLY